MDNYAQQMILAQKRFLSYDQEAIIRKLRLPSDADFLYPTLFSRHYRLCRKTGRLEQLVEEHWVDANTFSQVLTVLDLLCDCREDRSPAGEFQLMEHFGLMFHRSLLHRENDPLAQAFDRFPHRVCQVCRELKGCPIPGGDAAFAFPVMDGLKLALQFWHSDEDFPPQVRCFWDKNALQYLKYETMFYALGLLLEDIRQGCLQHPEFTES